MQSYTDWIKLTPEQLILKAEAEIKEGLLPRQRSIKKYLTGFRKHLQEQGLAPYTIKGRMTGVKSFYESFDIEAPKLQKSGNAVAPLEENLEIPTKEDLRIALNLCDPLEKAILLVGSSSGLSANEIINLKVKDFNNGFDENTKITTLKLRREKTNVDFITFLSPESSRAVLEYLNYRKRTVKTREIGREQQLAKQIVYADNNYLFIGRHIPYSFLTSRDESERKLELKALLKIYRKISEKAQKNTPKGNWNLIRSHNIRKYFNSTLVNNGCENFDVEFFMGHKIDSTRNAYFRPEAEKLKEIYQKYVPYLTIQKPFDASESPEFQKVILENKALKADNTQNVVDRYEIQELKEELKIERADRYEYERNVESMINNVVSEKMAEAMKALDGSLGRLAKNMKNPPIDLKEE
jgi:integrase